MYSPSKLELLKARFHQWALDSTAHGIPRIFETDKLILRIMWAVCFLLSTAACCYVITCGVLDYLEFNTNTQIRIVSQYDDFQFPQVSICNYNPFPSTSGKTFILNFMRSYYNNSNISSLNDIFTIYKPKMAEISSIFKIMRESLVSKGFNKTQRKTFGFTPSDMIVKCKYADGDCDTDLDFVYSFDANFGSCFIYNSGVFPNGSERAVKIVDRAGKTYGFVFCLFN
jgi:hypothetical protein